MPASPEPDREAVEALLAFSTPSVLNGLKRLGMHPSQLETLDRLAIGCMSPGLGARVGFAAPRKIATRRHDAASPPGPSKLVGGRADDHVLAVREPRILVAQNVGDWRGPVCIWGEVTDAALAALFAAADVYVSLSIHEGFGVPLLESMRASVPVVARAAGAVEATLGGAGLLLEQAEPSYVAAAVHRVLDDEVLHERLVRAGHEQIAAHSLAAAGGRAVEAIASVAGPPPGRPARAVRAGE